MTLSRVHTTSHRQNYATPVHVVNAMVRRFGGIAHDPCWARHSPIVAPVRWLVGGLDRPWERRGLVYVNPPYNEMKSWIAHGRAQAARGSEVLFCIPARVETRWWNELVDPYVLQQRQLYEPESRAPGVGFFRQRLRFLLPREGESEGAPFPSALVYLGERAEAFAGLCADLNVRRWQPLPEAA